MIDSTEVELEAICVHRIGNKLRQEGTTLSRTPLNLSKDVKAPLLYYFFNHFKAADREYRLTHPAGVSQNAIYTISSQLF